jgi:hypothetical protein
MSPEKQNATQQQQSQPPNPKIDPNAPAGSKNSLGAQSVRDGRPNTDDSVVEAMDEMGPGTDPDLGKDR